MKPDLLCSICGKTCPCMIYGKEIEHVHMPGGIDNYPLCAEHQEECLAIHRTVDMNGNYKWIENCSNSDCGFCQAVKSR